MRKSIKNKIRDILRFILGVKGYTVVRFILTHMYIPCLDNPRSFSEKIITRKFSPDSANFSPLVDKYLVREYVSKKVGNEYLVPLIKVVEFLTPSDFEDLPNSFVIKTSNGGGGENVLIVENKSQLDIHSVCTKFNSYLKEKIGSKIDEYFYDLSSPTILIEKLLLNKDGLIPSDYKFHVFSNDSNNLIIQIDEDRFTNHKRSLFDENLQRLNFSIQPKYAPVADNYQFPNNILDMINLAKCLADEFKYVRVDLYNVDGKVYFGELTFCHGSGWEPISPKEADFMLGSYWKEFN